MNQLRSLKFKNYLHITALHMITFYYCEILYSNKNVKDLCDMFELNRLIKDPKSFKSSNPSYIDNFYTNKKTMFFNSYTVETGISDHHSLIYAVIQQNLHTTGLITTIIKNTSKRFENRD